MIRIVEDKAAREAWWCEERLQAAHDAEGRALVRCRGRRREVDVRAPANWEMIPPEAMLELIAFAIFLGEGNSGTPGSPSRADEAAG